MTEFTKLTPSYQGGEFAKPEHVIEVQEAFAPIESELADHEARVTAAEGAVTRLGLVGQGNRRPAVNLAFIGDSITAYADTFQIYMEIESMYRLTNQYSASFSGQNSASVATHISDITSLDPKPDACLVLVGSNNAVADNALATFTPGVLSMVAALRAANIVPILGTVPPVNTHALSVNTYNVWLHAYARAQGLVLVDFNRALADPTTGNWKSGYDVGDGVHPAYVAQKAMGHAIVQALGHWVLDLPVQDVQRTQGAPNAFTASGKGDSFLLVDTEPDGRADMFTGGTGGGGVTQTLEADSDGGGFNWQKIVVANGTGLSTLGQNTALLPSGWNIGDIVEASALVEITNLDSDSYFNIGVGCVNSGFSFVAGSYSNIAIVHTTVSGMVRRRFVVPATAIGFKFQAQYGPGDGTYRIGLPTIRNLTALGLA